MLNSTSSKYAFENVTDWWVSLQDSIQLFKKTFYKSPSCLLVGVETLEEISTLPEPPGCHIRKDLLGRINFIIHDNFVLDVLIINLPYRSFSLISDPSDVKLENYQRILNEAVSTLNNTRNDILDYIRLLSLHGEMSDVNEMLQANGIHLNHYNLDDFKRVEDRNVRQLTETWYFLNEKIITLEDDDL